MYLFFGKGMGGRFSHISKRYSNGNNKCLNFYNSKQESQHIIYLDTNNLYGYAMSKFLPMSGIKWIDAKKFDLNKHKSNASKGYVLEVNLEHPQELRELHNDYPLTRDRIKINGEILSCYQIKMLIFTIFLMAILIRMRFIMKT